MTSTTSSDAARMSSKDPRERVSTPVSSGRRPVSASTSSARASSSSAKAEPTVPNPSSPTPKRSGMLDVPRQQVLVGLAAHDDPRVAALDHHDRRAGHAVVGVRHGEAVGAGGRGDDDVAHARVRQLGVAHDQVARLAVLAHEVAVRPATEARSDLRLVARAVEHRAQVVGHAAVDGDVEVDVALHGLHRVQGDGRVGDERAPRLVEDAHAGAHDVLHRGDLGGHVLLDRRRVLGAHVRDAQPAAEVDHPVRGQLRHGLERGAKAADVVDLRPDVQVQALQLEAVRRVQALDRGRRRLQPKAELRVRAARRDRRMRVGADAGRHAQLHALHRARRHSVLEQVDVGVVVDHDVPDAGVHGLGDLLRRLRVAVQVDARGVEGGLEGDGQLAARGDVAGQALLAEDAQHRRAGERLGGEVDLEVLAARGVGGDEGPRALAHVVLDDHVGRRAELARQLDRVASAQLEVPGLGDPAAEWIDVAELGRHGARKDTFARPRGPGPRRSGRSRAEAIGLPTRLYTRLMTPLLALHAATAALPVRWEATLLGGGWRGSADDDLLPAAGLLIDAGFEGAVALEGARVLGWDRRRLVAGRSRAGIRLVDDLVARVGKATLATPYGWCERAAVFAPDAVNEELVELGLVEWREAGWLRRALRYKAFELLDTGARDVAAARVRDAVADPDGAPDTAVALALLLRATGLLSRVAGAPPSRRIERALEERRQELAARP